MNTWSADKGLTVRYNRKMRKYENIIQFLPRGSDLRPLELYTTGASEKKAAKFTEQVASGITDATGCRAVVAISLIFGRVAATMANQFSETLIQGRAHILSEHRAPRGVGHAASEEEDEIPYWRL